MHTAVHTIATNVPCSFQTNRSEWEKWVGKGEVWELTGNVKRGQKNTRRNDFTKNNLELVSGCVRFYFFQNKGIVYCHFNFDWLFVFELWTLTLLNQPERSFINFPNILAVFISYLSDYFSSGSSNCLPVNTSSELFSSCIDNKVSCNFRQCINCRLYCLALIKETSFLLFTEEQREWDFTGLPVHFLLVSTHIIDFQTSTSHLFICLY